MKAALLVHVGDEVLSIDEDGTEPEDDLDEYKKLIQKAIELPRLAKNVIFMDTTMKLFEII